MKLTAVRLIRRLVASLVGSTCKTSVGRVVYNQVIDTMMGRTMKISHGSLDLVLQVPNQLCYWRAQTFALKEPETLEWIDSLPEGAILWDVGANIGLYSIYAAKRRNCRVWSFEPSVFNLELLARNVYLNDLAERVCLVPLALSDSLGSAAMRLTSTDWGGALSTFGKNYGWDGKALSQVFEFQTVGLSMVDALQRLGLPQPDYMKLDVDGIEHVILAGGAPVLAQVKGVHIEVNDDFHEQAEQCQRLLTAAGLVLKDKRHSDMIENSPSGFQHTFNQTWGRP